MDEPKISGLFPPSILHFFHHSIPVSTVKITYLIIGITVLLSWQAFNNRAMFEKLLHSPYLEDKRREWYRLLTGVFLHGSWTHLLINMFVLWQFGELVETIFTASPDGTPVRGGIVVRGFGETTGRLLFVLFYFLTAILADLPTFFKHRNNPGFRSVGASGAVSALLFVYIIFYPWNLLWIYFIIPVPGILAAVGYLVYSSYANRRGHSRIDHSAHLWGAVAGFALAIALRPAWFGVFVENLMAFEF